MTGHTESCRSRIRRSPVYLRQPGAHVRRVPRSGAERLQQERARPRVVRVGASVRPLCRLPWCPWNLPSRNTNSTLHAANVADTCAKCHRFIRERLNKSVHGRGNGPGPEHRTRRAGWRDKAETQLHRLSCGTRSARSALASVSQPASRSVRQLPHENCRRPIG